MSETQQELILGKYKDTEELTSAYKSLKASYDDLAADKNKYTVPEEYNAGEEFKLVNSDIIEKARDRAIDNRYTQSQFEKTIERFSKKAKDDKKATKALHKEFDDIDLLKSYVVEDMGLSEKLFGKLSKNDLSALKHLREDGLNTSTTVGSSSVAEPSKITQSDIYDAFKELESARKAGIETDKYLEKYQKLIKKANA